jgi:hypothetical protein
MRKVVLESTFSALPFFYCVKTAGGEIGKKGQPGGGSRCTEPLLVSELSATMIFEKQTGFDYLDFYRQYLEQTQYGTDFIYYMRSWAQTSFLCYLSVDIPLIFS